MSSTQDERPKATAVPYQGKPLPNVPNDLVIPNVLSLDFDERLWVSQAPDIWFRPLVFSVSQGYFVNLLRVRKSGILSRHRHTGPVHNVNKVPVDGPCVLRTSFEDCGLNEDNFAHPLFLSMITVGMWDRFGELTSRARSFRLDSFLGQLPNWSIMLGFYHYVGGIYFGLIVASRAVRIYNRLGLS